VNRLLNTSCKMQRFYEYRQRTILMKKVIAFVIVPVTCFLLCLPIVAQSLLKNGKIPNDFEITVTSTDGQKIGTKYFYRITSDGRVFSEDHGHILPWGRSSLLIVQDPQNKENRRRQLPVKNKLSKNQLKQMIRGFESFGFFGLENSYYGYPDQRNASCSSQGGVTNLSILASGWHKNVSVYFGCPYTERSFLNGFWKIYDKIMISLRGIKFIETKKDVSNMIID
jgi:hypothetical protein